jgi:hypothetical protein
MRERSPDPPQRQPRLRLTNRAATLNNFTVTQDFRRGSDLITVLASEKSLEILANRDSGS